MLKSRLIVLGLFVWLASPGLLPAAQAQTSGPTVLVHAVDPPQSVTPESGGIPGLLVRATFSLLNADGTILKSDIENATLRLGNDSYTSKFSKLQTDWSVVLLLDTSGTMSVGAGYSDYRAVRDALSRSVASAPQNASFALIPFSDRAPTALEFTPDRDKLTNALKTLQPGYGKPACLNDGLYEAIAKLASAPGRRAVFAITASADSCATRSGQMIVDYAKQNQVELYAAGVEGYTITRQELDAFTQPTGGLSQTRGASELSFALDNLMSFLGSQWQAVWVVYPPAGPQTAELGLKLPDATVVSGSLSFVSDRQYTRPPSVSIAGTAQSTLGGVRFNLDVNNPERIHALDVNLISKLTGRSVYEKRLTALTDSILVPSDNLVKGGEYSLVLTALDDQGQALSQTAPLDFRYEPLEPSLTATVKDWPAAAQPYYVISAVVQNLEGVAKFRLWLEQEQGSAPVKGTEVTYPAGQELHVPVSAVGSGNYVVRVQALDQNDRVLVETVDLKVAYQAPGILSRMVASLQGSPVAVAGLCLLGGVAVVGLGALGWFLVPKGRGMKNVELVLPEKARRPPRPAEPVTPPAKPAAAARAAPPAPAQAERQPPPARPPRPAPPPVQAAPVQPVAPPPPAQAEKQPPRAETPRPSPPPAQAAPVQPVAPPAPAQVEKQASPAQPPRPSPPPAQAAPVQPIAPPGPAQVEKQAPPAQPPRPSAPPAQAAPAPGPVAPKQSEILAVVATADPGMPHFEAEIRKSPFRIGRANDNDGAVPVDATSGVSGHHCVITFADGRWYVQDDQSKFGTTVNGQLIPKGQPFSLGDGALIGLGPRLRIHFRIGSGTPSRNPR